MRGWGNRNCTDQCYKGIWSNIISITSGGRVSNFQEKTSCNIWMSYSMYGQPKCPPFPAKHPLQATQWPLHTMNEQTQSSGAVLINQLTPLADYSYERPITSGPVSMESNCLVWSLWGGSTIRINACDMCSMQPVGGSKLFYAKGLHLCDLTVAGFVYWIGQQSLLAVIGYTGELAQMKGAHNKTETDTLVMNMI